MSALTPESTDAMRLSLLRFKKIIPIPEQSMVQMLCYLLECLLTPENTPADCAKELYELYFVFAAVWAFGGAMFQDQVVRGPLTMLGTYFLKEFFALALWIFLDIIQAPMAVTQLDCASLFIRSHLEVIFR